MINIASLIATGYGGADLAVVHSDRNTNRIRVRDRGLGYSNRGGGHDLELQIVAI